MFKKSLFSNFTSYLIIFLVFCFCRCEVKALPDNWIDPFAYSTDSLFIDWSVYMHCDSYIIEDTIDLQGKSLYLPPNIRIIMKGGMFKNGNLVGNNTRLKYNNTIFDCVHIKGSWVVHCIKSKMFKDLSYDNALKDVLALASPSIKNKIIIEKGRYNVTARCYSDACLVVCSNTDLLLDGDIFLTPNGYTLYSIIRTEGENIVLRGSGSVVGDRFLHTSNEGEWGMGVFVRGGDNVKIQGITIKDCWGDCIYVTEKAGSVVVDGCHLEQGRRQGISIISVRNVLINNCTITKIWGTNPQYAIDVEPNANDTVENVLINDVKIENCVGGITANGRAKKSIIASVIVKNCSVKNTKNYPIQFVECGFVRVDNCMISDFESDYVMNCLDDDVVFVNGNKIIFPDDSIKIIDQENVLNSVIRIMNVKNKKLNNNKIK